MQSQLDHLAFLSSKADANTWVTDANRALRTGSRNVNGKSALNDNAPVVTAPPVGRIISPSASPGPNAASLPGMSGPSLISRPVVNSPPGLNCSIPSDGLDPTTPVCPVQHAIGNAASQILGLSPQSHNMIPASAIDELSGVDGPMPRFIRRRSAPVGHCVVSDCVDAEMYDKGEKDITDMKDLSIWLKAGKENTKDEPWTRLTELSCFGLCGFGQFDSTLAIGVYNKDSRTALLRQGATERERMWDLGARAPVGNRIATGVASLNWGTLTNENIPDETLMVSDFLPWTLDAYEKFQPMEKKMEFRKKQGMGISKFVKAGRHHTLFFAFSYGEEHDAERLACILELEKIHEARPEISPVDFILDTFEEMNYRYIAQIRDGTRKIMRLGGDGMRKPGFARIALCSPNSNWPRWEYPPLFL